MTRLTASAPGKLILLGEYAVLFGHPAAVLAVDRRATVELSSSAGGFSVDAPGLVSEPLRITFGDFSAAGRPIPDETGLPLVDAVLGALLERGTVDAERLEPFDAVLDSGSFFDGGTKLGLGSSAALTVALASALTRWAGRGELLEPRIEWLGSLLHLHRHFQGGRGSGIDLAASLFGGTLEYRLAEDGSVGTASPIRLPNDLHMAFVWTRRSADTGSFLARLSAVMEHDRKPVDRALTSLGEISGGGVEALRRCATGAFLDAVDDFYEGMVILGELTGLHIVSEVHRELRALVVPTGARYKPSGAGGGDMGLILAGNRRTLDAAIASVGGRGFEIPSSNPDPAGLVMTLD
jgi:phosphomevalonate kinase